MANILAQRLSSAHPISYCYGIWVSPKIRVIPSVTIVRMLNLADFSAAFATALQSSQLSLTSQVCHTEHPSLFTTHCLQQRALRQPSRVLVLCCMLQLILVVRGSGWLAGYLAE